MRVYRSRKPNHPQGKPAGFGGAKRDTLPGLEHGSLPLSARILAGDTPPKTGENEGGWPHVAQNSCFIESPPKTGESEVGGDTADKTFRSNSKCRGLAPRIITLPARFAGSHDSPNNLFSILECRGLAPRIVTFPSRTSAARTPVWPLRVACLALGTSTRIGLSLRYFLVKIRCVWR